MDYHGTLTVQRLKELHRMHRGHHGSPYPMDGHLLERVLGNVCRVLGPLGNTLKGSRCSRWFGIIRKQRVIIYERGNSSNESKIVSVKSGIVWWSPKWFRRSPEEFQSSGKLIMI
jgi:hypothetical protein